MYEAYYGLSANPFRLAPDPQFFYESVCHKRGLAYLRYGLQQGQGFVVVTGVPGTGKSLLVQTIFAELAGQRMVVSSISNTNLEADDVLRAVANSFDVYCTDTTKAALLNALERFLIEKNRQGKRVLLIVDEAQNLPVRSLEELRMLSNFQRGDQPLMQIMLLGQQQFQQKLADPNMEQFTQRVIASCHLKPLDLTDTRGYIEYRLSHVGWSGKPSFTGEALGLVHHISRGIPRLINTFCDRLLLAAYLDEKQQVDAPHVRMVLQELQSEATGSWQSVDLNALPITTLAPLPDGEVIPPKRAESRPADPAMAAEKKAIPPKPSVRAVADQINALKNQSQSAAIAPPISAVAKPAKQFADSRVATNRQQVAAQIEREYVAPLVQTEPEPLPDYIAADANVVLLPLSNDQEEDGQPPELEYKDHAAILARRWWVAAALVVMMVITVFLVVMFTTGNKKSASPVPVQNQRAVVPLESNRPLESAPVIVEPLPAVEDGQSFNDESSVEPAVVVASHSEPEAIAEVTPGPVAPVKTAVIPEPLPAAKQPLTPRIEVADLPPPSLRVPGAVSEPAKGQLEHDSLAKPSIAELELPELIDSYLFAYESGDLDRFVGLFSENATVDKSLGRNRISRDYLELFRATDARHMKIGAIKWKTAGATAHGSSEFEVTVWRHGDSTPTIVKGQLNIEVAKQDQQLVIRKLTHVVSR